MRERSGEAEVWYEDEEGEDQGECETRSQKAGSGNLTVRKEKKSGKRDCADDFPCVPAAEPGASQSKIAASTLNAYVSFHTALRKAHDRFVRKLASQCKDRARHHLLAATSAFSPTDTWEPAIPPLQYTPFGEQQPLYHPENGVAAVGPQGGAAVSMRMEHSSVDAGSPTMNNQARSGYSDEGENVQGLGKQAGKGSPSEEGQEHFRERESHLTVPETPSPDQGVSEGAGARRKEYAAASGRPSAFATMAANGAAANANLGFLKRFNTQIASNGGMGGPVVGDGAAPKKRSSAASGSSAGNGSHRWINGKAPKVFLQGKSEYSDVCAMMIEQFSRIREVVAHRLVPSTLSAGFITPCREELGISIAVELFACEDASFMELFVAPGAVEGLRSTKAELQRRSESLERCMQEFRALARTL